LCNFGNKQGGCFIEELCRKFPKICNCPYKEDIDKDLKEGRSPYYIAKWLKETECSISETTIRTYKKYLIQRGMLDTKVTPKPKPQTNNKEAIFEKAESLLGECLDSINFEQMSDNVKVQFALGMMKILYPQDGIVESEEIEITDEDVEWINNVSDYQQ